MKAPDQSLVIIDANSSGVSGDKYLGALVNMGGSVESLRKVAKVVAEYLPGASNGEVEARRVERGGIGGDLGPSKSEGKGARRTGGVSLCCSKRWARKVAASGGDIWFV